MGTLFVQGRGMVVMLVGHMLHKWIPLGPNQFPKPGGSGCSTPIQMVACSFNPIYDFLAPLLFPKLYHCLCNWTGHMPNVKVVRAVCLTFPYPFGNSSVSVRNENFDGYASRLKIWKSPFHSFEFHGCATAGLICLKEEKIHYSKYRSHRISWWAD